MKKDEIITAEREDSGGAVCCRRPQFRAGDRSECGAGAMPSEAEDRAGAIPDYGGEAVQRC